MPRIGSGGKKPSTVYARTTSASMQMSDAPKIAIVLGGMGLNQELTAKAIKALPGDVSFAFAPYGENLQVAGQQGARRRSRNHAAASDGALRLSGHQSRARRRCSSPQARKPITMRCFGILRRFAGYIGASAYMGGNFLADPAALRPILAETEEARPLFPRRRALRDAAVVADVGRMCRPAGAARRKSSSMPMPKPRRSPRRWQQLEEEARQSGIAIGTGTGLEVTIEEVQEWAKTLNERGILLIPLSAAYRGRTG